VTFCDRTALRARAATARLFVAAGACMLLLLMSMPMMKLLRQLLDVFFLVKY